MVVYKIDAKDSKRLRSLSARVYKSMKAVGEANSALEIARQDLYSEEVMVLSNHRIAGDLTYTDDYTYATSARIHSSELTRRNEARVAVTRRKAKES